MRIGISTLTINRLDFGGGETYLRSLLAHLSRLDSENEYLVFVSAENRGIFDSLGSNFRLVNCPGITSRRPKRVFYEHIRLPSLMKKLELDIFHSPGNTLPLGTPVPSVVTFQFMINFVMPEHFKPAYKRYYFNTMMKHSASRAERIISVSENLKREIVNHLEVDGDKVVVIPHGADDSFSPADNGQVAVCLRKYGIKSPYLLCVANNVPSKNLEGLIDAYDYLKGRYHIPHRLVLAGSHDIDRDQKERLSSCLATARNLKSGRDVITTGFIGKEDLRCLYSGAFAFVLPSLCESFCIPLVEAMKCGTPVVTSNISAMPEVVGNAALSVDPTDSKEIAAAVLTLMESDKERERLSVLGLEKAQEYSWERAARKTLTVYENIHSMRKH